MRQEIQSLEYLLDTAFFVHIGGEDVQKGKVQVKVVVAKVADTFSMAFHLAGVATVPCDRCLDDMDYPIDFSARLIVKFGKDYSEESDEIVVVPESEGAINLAWFLYEFVVLAIPIKHVHAPGKCNKQMSVKLKKHSPKTNGDDEGYSDGDDGYSTDDEPADDDSTDPRWDALKDLELD
jgi:uncharacterized metal-binding protein YceD (DUF177 family)